MNYYNAALAATRFAIATKLDDDHLAIPESTRALTDRLRREGNRVDAMHCFSGLNLIRGADGRLGIVASAPISGGGGIGWAVPDVEVSLARYQVGTTNVQIGVGPVLMMCPPPFGRDGYIKCTIPP